MKRIISILLFTVLIFSCEEYDNFHDGQPVNRTIIVYMAADNDLSADALADIEEMKQGFSQKGTNLIVFADLLNENPYLLEINQEKETVIKFYSELNSADPEIMKQILQEVIERYPAQEYGLILWSHGTSWMPAGNRLRSFGKDSGKEINIPDLADALPVKFDFILMDACLMGAVEVAYELKDKTDFIIASSTETIYTGFPYDQIIPELLASQINLKAVAQHYFDYYNSLQGAYRSATISVIETQYLPELANQLKRLFNENEINRMSINRSSVQRLDVYEEQYTFDLLDFVNTLFPTAEKEAFVNQLNRTVIYKAHTPMFLSDYEIKTYSGLSCYIPVFERNDLNEYYYTLQWFNESGFNNLLESRTNVEPIYKTQPGQDNLSAQRTPKELLPP
jgi:hypothetical protein